MNRSSITLFKKIFYAVETFQTKEFRDFFVDNLMDQFNVNLNTDWIQWLIDTNNYLSRHYTDGLPDIEGVRSFHEVLAELLAGYDEEVNPDSDQELYKSSLYRRDILLLRQYNFQSFPLIKKQINPEENLPMCKNSYYRCDFLFEQIFSPREVLTPVDNIDSPCMSNHLKYLEDPHFIEIINYFKTHPGNKVKFAGISATKGGIFNVLHIILDQKAQIRFLGGITPSLQDTSAYKHGPIFMTTSNWDKLTPTHVYDINISNLQFIIPNLQVKEELHQLLINAEAKGLISKEEVHRLLDNQIVTYQEYQDHIYGIDNPPPTSGTSDSASNTMSELISSWPLTPHSPLVKHSLFPPISSNPLGIERALDRIFN
ncbi:hypothetical protein ACD661_11795 [Legionella lytica]|uniref:Uncharacterized protein n=1 Tax=Legionella lytica TaxID=96232 RepID=A0ABW8D954_9GAMM